MSNVIKQNIGYTFQGDDRRVIDTNQLIANRLELLSQLMQKQVSEQNSFQEDFTQGLDAMQVEKLLADEDSGDSADDSNVIKAKAAVTEEEIRQKCDEMLAEAKAQADSIIEAAQADADMIRENAQKAGHEAGYAEGYDEGKSVGLREYDMKLNEIRDKEKQLEADYESKIEELEPQFVNTLTSIYEHVFRISLADNKEIIFNLIQDAIRKVEGSKTFIIHVSKEDYGYVSMQKKELLAGFSGAEGTEIVEDMTLHQNECFIETGSGIFDCSLETQLEGLKRELRLLSFNPD